MRKKKQEEEVRTVVIGQYTLERMLDGAKEAWIECPYCSHEYTQHFTNGDLMDMTKDGVHFNCPKCMEEFNIIYIDYELPF